MILLILAVSLGVSVAMMLVWAFQRAVNNGGWTDVGWTFVTGAAGVVYALWPLGAEISARQWLCAGLIAVWSLRLGVHLARRVGSAPSEDARYARFRRDWAPKFQARMFSFLQTQAVAGALLAVAVLAAARNPAPGLGWQDAAGAALMLVAILGEGLADAQLARWKRDPANHGGICEAGLWGWSRHPNYFFEWLVWLGWPLIAIAPGHAWGWSALIGPAFILLLLIKVSGLPPLEAAMLRSRGDAWRDYQRRVSSFIPLPPKMERP